MTILVIGLAVRIFNKLTSCFTCVCPIIDHEFRHNIVKVAVNPQTTLTMLVTKFIVNKRTDVLKTDINLFFTIANCPIARPRSLTRRINYKFLCLPHIDNKN